MTVWNLMVGELHEGGDVKGVFASRDLARGWIVDEAHRLPFDLDDARQDPDGSIRLTAGCDYLSLTPHDVVNSWQIGGRS